MSYDDLKLILQRQTKRSWRCGRREGNYIAYDGKSTNREYCSTSFDKDLSWIWVFQISIPHSSSGEMFQNFWDLFWFEISKFHSRSYVTFIKVEQKLDLSIFKRWIYRGPGWNDCWITCHFLELICVFRLMCIRS